MKFESLQRRVDNAERLLHGRGEQTRRGWAAFKQAWHDGWSPGRIVIVGMVSGFLTGRAEPLGSLSGARWMQMITSASSLVASLQAAATQQAENPADDASDVATPEERLVDEVFDEELPAPIAPRPAEAATELSERW